jgi:hypothetical protein
MPIDECFERAHRSHDPWGELRSLTLTLSTQGQDRATIIDHFEATREQLRHLDREADEDVLMDVLDRLVG